MPSRDNPSDIGSSVKVYKEVYKYLETFLAIHIYHGDFEYLELHNFAMKCDDCQYDTPTSDGEPDWYDTECETVLAAKRRAEDEVTYWRILTADFLRQMASGALEEVTRLQLSKPHDQGAEEVVRRLELLRTAEESRYESLRKSYSYLCGEGVGDEDQDSASDGSGLENAVNGETSDVAGH